MLDKLNGNEISGKENFDDEYESVLKSIQLSFYRELREAHAGKKTSLPFILHTLSSAPAVSENEIFQVMVIGGSVFKQALVKKEKDKIFFLNKTEENLPVFNTEEDLCSLTERHLSPEVKTVSINFAYPLLPVIEKGVIDGILATATKEHKFSGLIGKQVGQALEEYFWKKKNKKITFAVANDTVCLLLSGLGLDSWDKLACGIVGTGINFAFFTKQNELVNLESGNFDKFPRSQEAQEIDRASSQSGRGLYEKETSGLYLYQHFNSILIKKKLAYSPLSSTAELSALTKKDEPVVSQTARELMKKSAGLIAAQIAGITLFKNSDMTFMMEGSLFWEGEDYKNNVDIFVKMLIPDQKVDFVSVAESYFLGAARLVLK